MTAEAVPWEPSLTGMRTISGRSVLTSSVVARSTFATVVDRHDDTLEPQPPDIGRHTER